MREEIWRMDNVTNEAYGITQLRQFNLQIHTGEILGLLPLNANGLDALLELLQHNTPIHFGRVYCEERLVNSHIYHKQTPNPVALIEKRSHLVDGLSVADNVFVLNRRNKSVLIHPARSRRQLRELEEAIDVQIPSGQLVRELSFLQRCIVEILKAVVSKDRLIVIRDVSHFMTDQEVRKLHEVMGYFAGKGTSFLYICNQWHETAAVCGRVALMHNGTISKVIGKQEMKGPYMEKLLEEIGGVGPERPHSSSPRTDVCFRVEALSAGMFHDLDFHVCRGECLVIHSENQNVLDGIRRVMLGDEPIAHGRILVAGRKRHGGCIREREIAYLAENPVESMLFFHMSNLENLTFGLIDQRQVRWNRKKIYRSLQMELGEELGAAVFEKDLSELSVYDQYTLLFYRLLLQRPQVVFCEHPFFGNDVYLRKHVIELVRQLLRHQIAVVILVVGIYDTFPLADRNLIYHDGKLKACNGTKTEAP